MTDPRGATANGRRLRWSIATLLFVSMVINYIDRQTFNGLSPFIIREFDWTLAEFGTLLISFRIAYTVMQAIAGRLLDRVGTRRGLAASVAFYSAMSMLTAAAGSIGQFRAVRSLLGAGEAANWPGAIKASAEWFPADKRASAVALFDSGTALGGALAPIVALVLFRWFDDWRPVCLLTGSLGLPWIVAWLMIYRDPTQANPSELAQPERAKVTWRELLGYRQTWGIMLGRFLLDPYWFFVSEWFPLFLKSRGFSTDESVLGLAAPLAASILGNFAGSGLSNRLIARGWPVGRSRRFVLAAMAPTMLILVLALAVTDYFALVAIFSYANFAYAACSTMFLSLPADVFDARAVASASGLGGSAAGAGTLLSTWLIGQIADQYSFDPIVLAASIIPPLAAAVFVVLVRRGETLRRAADRSRFLTVIRRGSSLANPRRNWRAIARRSRTSPRGEANVKAC